MTRPPATRQVGSHLGHYEIIRLLGAGGMGEVYLARDTRLARLVAIKVLLGDDAERAERFMTEARATARCVHENIVVIHEVGEHEGTPYLVLEYIQGQSLAAYRSGRRFTSERAIELILPVARALECAHRHHIVHRDLKPSNVMLADSGTIKVLDFGIAQYLAPADDAPADDATEGEADGAAGEAAGRERAAARDRARMGTLPYMAPEQHSGETIDERADIWAVGLILFELVTGQHPLAPLRRQSLATIPDAAVPMPGVRDAAPGLGPLADLIDRCLRKDPAERVPSASALLTELQAVLASERGALDDERNPYSGLDAFDGQDAVRFFGRDRDIAAALARLREEPLIAVVGPSGVGKSSFVRAGVVPALERSGEAWESLGLRPGRHPMTALASLLGTLSRSHHSLDSTLRRRIPTAQEALADDELTVRLRAEPGYLGTTLRHRATRRLCRIALVIDQFEELVTLADRADAAAFLACLQGAADDPAAPIRIVVTLRSDFLDRVIAEPHAGALIGRRLMVLPPLDAPGLRAALERPLALAGYRFEDDRIVESMVAELSRAVGSLPLLQFTAARLWERRDRSRRLLTWDSYRDMGGVAGPLANHADAALAAMTAGQRLLAQTLLLRLVTPERTRALATVEELHELGEGEAIDEILQRLTSARLLVIDNRSGETTVELVHESLIENWPALADLLEENQEATRFLAVLRSAAKDWDANERAEGMLWRDQAQVRAARWRERYQGELAQLERDYLDAVFELATRQRRRRRRWSTLVVAALTLTALLMTYLAWRESQSKALARAQAERAVAQASRAHTAQQRAQQASARAQDAARMLRVFLTNERDPTTATAIVREVEDSAQQPDWPAYASMLSRAHLARKVIVTDSSISHVRFNPAHRQLLVGHWGGTLALHALDAERPPIPLDGHTGDLTRLVFSADGQRVMTASREDGSARVWRTRDGHLLRQYQRPDARVGIADLSPDGRQLAVTTKDRTIWLVEVDQPDAPARSLARDIGGVLRFGSDGRYLTTTGDERGARVLDTSGERPAVLLPGCVYVGVVLLTRDNRRVVAPCADGTIRVWSVDGTPVASVPIPEEPGWGFSLSPDGTRVTTGAGTRVAHVVALDGSGPTLTLRGHENLIHSASFSPDSRWLVTASLDATVRVWRADRPAPAVILRGHGDELFDVDVAPLPAPDAAPAPDATSTPDAATGMHARWQLATGSADHSARIWHMETPISPEPLADDCTPIAPMHWHRATSLLALTCDRATVRLLRVTGNRPAQELAHEPGTRITHVHISPMGDRLVTADWAGVARVWSTEDARPVAILRGHRNTIWSTRFSPDGQRVLTGSWDGTARIWRADGTGDAIELTGHTEQIWWADFDRQGRRVVTTSWDRSARIWQLDQPDRFVELRGHRGKVRHAVFSADGTRVVTAGYDHTARIWQADTGVVQRVLAGHDARITRVAFSPDDRRVLTISDDQTARVWSVADDRPPVVLRGHEKKLLTGSFSDDGRRVITSSADERVRVWNADGTGVPAILPGARWAVSIDAAASDVITGGATDGPVRWRAVRPHDSADELRARLWQATEHCLDVAERVATLGSESERARANYQECRRRAAVPSD